MLCQILRLINEKQDSNFIPYFCSMTIKIEILNPKAVIGNDEIMLLESQKKNAR